MIKCEYSITLWIIVNRSSSFCAFSSPLRRSFFGREWMNEIFFLFEIYVKKEMRTKEMRKRVINRLLQHSETLSRLSLYPSSKIIHISFPRLIIHSYLSRSHNNNIILLTRNTKFWVRVCVKRKSHGMKNFRRHINCPFPELFFFFFFFLRF